jgi:1,4-dihydroxy-6-naphthoate synthase
VSDKYALLPCGASLGDGYGPLLVAREHLEREQIARHRIAVPGTMTSAFLALQLWLARPAAALEVMVVPFDRVFATVKAGDADAGLIIHEGQLTWQKEGLRACADLGAWWSSANAGLPLPLGGNVVHKRLAPAERGLVARIVRASVQFGLEHRPEAVQHALQFARELEPAQADRFIGLYVNHWTLDFGERGREAIRRFLGQAHAAGLVPHPPDLEFVAPISG